MVAVELHAIIFLQLQFLSFALRGSQPQGNPETNGAGFRLNGLVRVSFVRPSAVAIWTLTDLLIGLQANVALLACNLSLDSVQQCHITHVVHPLSGF